MTQNPRSRSSRRRRPAPKDAQVGGQSRAHKSSFFVRFLVEIELRRSVGIAGLVLAGAAILARLAATVLHSR